MIYRSVEFIKTLVVFIEPGSAEKTYGAGLGLGRKYPFCRPLADSKSVRLTPSI